MGAMCKDPGYLKKSNDINFMQMLEQFDPVLLCPDCEIVRTDRSRHCSVCGKCVERFDHHCPWINSCVGCGNHGVFALFIVSMYALLISTATILLMHVEVHRFYNVDRTQFMFFIPMLLPQFCYDRVIILPIIYTCVAVCLLFAFPLT
jgi:hypothetical protein